MISSKKAAEWASIIFGLVILTVAIIIVLYLVRNINTDPVECMGTCVARDKCVWPNIVMSTKCAVDGDVQKGTVCCVNYDDLEKNESNQEEDIIINPEITGPTSSNNCNETTFPIIYFDAEKGNERARCLAENKVITCNIQQDEIYEEVNACSNSIRENKPEVYNKCCLNQEQSQNYVPAQIQDLKIGTTRANLPTHNLEVGRTYNLYVTTKGTDVKTCWIYTSDIYGELITIEGTKINQTIEGNCDDEHIILKPLNEDFQKYPEFRLGIIIKNNESEELSKRIFSFNIFNIN